MYLFKSLVSRIILLYILFSCTIIGLTKNADPPQHEADSSTDTKEDHNLGLEYERYLKQVLNVLESDEEFRKKVEEGGHNETHEISRYLEFASHRVRTKLDELKRKEIERLKKYRHVLDRRARIEGQHPDNYRMDFGHVNVMNEDSFEQEDLENLIKKTVNDLRKNDNERKEEFKEHEMRKEMARKKKFDRIKEAEERKHAEKEYQAELDRRKKHPKVNHPGREEQLEEVWEKQDDLPAESFNPKAFFQLHDLNSDGYLDYAEIEALMQTELDKVYPVNASGEPLEQGIDPNERYEEMNRMREEVYRETDKNADGLISMDEFTSWTTDPKYKEDDGNWPTLEDTPQFTDEEYKKFEKENQSWDEMAPPGERLHPTSQPLHAESTGGSGSKSDRL